jgi:glycosyltransferase involved in cell wall biosynthesis
MPKVSVIIPNYNHAPFLQQRIESILNQTFQDFELIILDDCSTDNSREILEPLRNHPKVTHLIFNKKNSGSPFKQWQKGIELAKGEFNWIAESDDWAETTFLSELVPLIEKEKNIGLCFCGSNWVDDNGYLGKDLSLYKDSFKRSGKDEITNTLTRYNTIQNVSAVLVRTELAKKNLKNIGQFKSCGDWYFYINILQESDIVFNKKKLNNFRWYHNNISNEAEKSGLWLMEGLKILASSVAYKSNFSFSQLKMLAEYWKLKIKSSGFKNRKIYWQFYKMMSIFIYKSVVFKITKN